MTDNEARLLTQVADMTEEMDRLRRKLAVAEQTNKNLRYCGNCRMVCPYICRSRGYCYDTWVYDRKRAFVGEDRK